MATGGAWIFYFADAPTLAREFITGQAPFVAYATVGVLTATTFIFGGFMREQVCMYMCPWPRIQGAMLDEYSLIVTYKDWRGEPRGKHRKRAGAEKLGDCIDCNACVAVCPMGVDIREGQQLGCITCALCIDACDEIMEKVGKPRGLIDYCTLVDAELERQGLPTPPLWKRIFRPRTIIYFSLWALFGLAMLVSLFMRDTVDISVAHDRNPVYVKLSDGSIRNGYTVKIGNQNPEPRRFRLAVKAEHDLRMDIQGVQGDIVEVGADSAKKLRVFLTVRPWFAMQGRMPVTFWIEDQATRERASYEASFIAPEPGE